MLAIRNLLSQIKLPQLFLSSKNFVFLGLVFALTACKSVQTATNSTINHATAQLQRDSIYIHDSIRVEYRRGSIELSPNSPDLQFIRSPDTVYLEKWHTRWREKEITRTDTVQVETTKTKTIQVRYVPRFYKYCAALTALLLLFLLIKLTLRLYKHFH